MVRTLALVPSSQYRRYLRHERWGPIRGSRLVNRQTETASRFHPGRFHPSRFHPSRFCLISLISSDFVCFPVIMPPRRRNRARCALCKVDEADSECSFRACEACCVRTPNAGEAECAFERHASGYKWYRLAAAPAAPVPAEDPPPAPVAAPPAHPPIVLALRSPAAASAAAPLGTAARAEEVDPEQDDRDPEGLRLGEGPARGARRSPPVVV